MCFGLGLGDSFLSRSLERGITCGDNRQCVARKEDYNLIAQLPGRAETELSFFQSGREAGVDYLLSTRGLSAGAAALMSGIFWGGSPETKRRVGLAFFDG